MLYPSVGEIRRHPLIPVFTMYFSHATAEFSDAIGAIRRDLYDLALDADKADRETLMKAAAALAFYQSDLMKSAAGPILPGEK